MTDLPELALSVRQPWAWAIIAGHKKVENRTRGAITSGRMTCRRIAIHAASGMKEEEFRWGQWRLHKHGVPCLRPDELIRSAIIGSVEVVDIVSRSTSDWFGGPMGLVLENAQPCHPIPCPGALGYFRWQAAGQLAAPAKWMVTYDRPNGDAETFDLFTDQQPTFARTPERPKRKTPK